MEITIQLSLAIWSVASGGALIDLGSPKTYASHSRHDHYDAIIPKDMDSGNHKDTGEN